MVYEIFTYGAGEYIIEVLNANVRIMGGDNFTTALKISLLFGFFAVLWDIAVNGGFSKGAKFYITALLAYNIIFVPKVDVIINDPVATIRTDRKIDNVPFGLAFFAHTVSSLGNWLTQTFEMNLSLPDDLKYNKNGMLFGNMVVKQTYTARMQDTRTASNFNNFIRQCLIQSIHLKRVKMEDALKAEDIATLLNYGSNGVLAYEYINTSNEVENKLCKDTTNLKSDLDTGVQKTITRLQSGSNGVGGTAIDYILGVQQSLTKTFEQTLIMNAVEDSTQEYLAMTGADAGATNYAITKDDLQKKQTGIIQWIQADKYLPALKIAFETMFYALFPIVVIMLMFPNGVKIFKSSMKILIWLQLWAPLYAVLNLIMTLEQKYRVSSLLSETGGIVSLYNRQAVFDISQGIAMQAGLLAWAIPVLSWKIVNGMEGFAEGLGGMSQAGMHSTNQVAGEIASGNLSYGNGSFRNMSWGNENFSNIQGNKMDTDTVKNYGKSFETGGDGITHGSYSDGLETTNMSRRLTSDLGVKFTSTEDQVNSSRIALNEAKSTSESQSNAYTKSLQDLQQFSFTDSSGNGKTHNFSKEASIKTYAGVGGKLGPLKGGIDTEAALKWADNNNISTEDRKTLTDLINKTNQHQISYNQALTEQATKQQNLDYSLATSTHAGINWNNEVEKHLREDKGWSQEKINNASLQEIQKIGNEYIKSQIYNKNTSQMLDNINNSIEIAKNQNTNQDKMIDNKYQYGKNNIDSDNSLKMFQNTDPTNWANFSTTKKAN